ncbi:MAG: VPLPA-CTERM sorting domain-containing protein [Gammaproteobacteria bacterium]
MQNLIKIITTPLLFVVSFSANAILFDFSGVADGDYNVGDSALTFSDSGITYTLSAPSTSSFFRFDNGQLLFGANTNGNAASQFNLTSFNLIVTGGDAQLLGYSTGNETVSGDIFTITGSNTNNNYDDLDGSTVSANAVFPTALTLTENAIYNFTYDLSNNGTDNGNNATNGVTGLSALSVDIAPSAVPVPAAVWLFGSALLGLAGFKRSKSSVV